VFRELLQNADDATATDVQVHFRSKGWDDSSPIVHSPDSFPNLRRHKIASMMIRNDGFAFRDEDWKRLKTIADGNPSGQSISSDTSTCADDNHTPTHHRRGQDRSFWSGILLTVFAL
jgi:hypothetical protein